MITKCLPVFVLVALLAGCASNSLERTPAAAKSSAFSSATNVADTSVPSMEASSIPGPAAPITRPKGTQEEFAQEIVRELSSGNPAALAKAIDLPHMVIRGAHGLEISRDSLQEFLNGFAKTFSLPQQVCNGVKQKGSLKFLRIREKNGDAHALVRAIVGGGVNYYEFLIKETDTAYRIDDVYIYMNGEYISDSIHRVLLPIALSQKEATEDAVPEHEIDFVKHAGDLTRMRQLAESGQVTEALAAYEGLPESLKNNKNVLLLRLTYATKASREEYAKAIDALQENFPDDPNLDLPRIDGLFMKGDRPGTLATIDRLNQTIGGDAYLDTLAGNIHVLVNEIELAKERYRCAIETEPELADPYWQLLALSLREKDYATTVEMLDKVENDLHFTLNDLTKVEIYKDFVESPEYASWAEKRVPAGIPTQSAVKQDTTK